MVNDGATLRFVNVPPECTEEILYELGFQFGPVISAAIPLDKRTHERFGLGFVQFRRQVDAEYAFECLLLSTKEQDAANAPRSMGRHVPGARFAVVHLFGTPVRVELKEPPGRPAAFAGAPGAPGTDSAPRVFECGAKLLVRNVAPAARIEDIARLFQQFGEFAAPPRMLRDDEGRFRGLVLLSYTDFAASDAVIRAMDGAPAFGGEKRLAVDYSDRPGGGKHGSAEERARHAARGDSMALLTKLKEEFDQQRRDEAAPAWASNLNPYAQL